MIVSLTSHAPRFGYLPDVINQLVQQTRTPDLICVNIDSRRIDELPTLRAGSIPIEIVGIDDIGPASKLLYTMQRYPDESIVTIDDDVTYRQDLLDNLYTLSSRAKDHVIATMARVIPGFPGGRGVPYSLWPYCHTTFDKTYSAWVMPLGAEGVLYPPRCLHPDVFDFETLRSLAPTTDDLWFWIHRVRQGSPVRVLNFRPRQPRTPGSEETALWAHNRAGVNISVKNSLRDTYAPRELSELSNFEMWAENLLLGARSRIADILRQQR